MKTRKLTVSILLRSIICNCYFYMAVGFFIIFILAPLSLLKSPKPMRKAILIYCKSVLYVFEKIGKIKIEERGVENIPRDKAMIYCSKHMSNLDALILFRQSPNLTALAKAEIYKVPFLNMVLNKMGVLAIKRGAGEAQKQTPELAKFIFDNKLPMIIFAEGTRTLIGERRPIKSGAFYYQQEEDIDIIVVAHNSGFYWPRKSMIKWPGTIIVEYFPSMAKGLSKEDFMAEVERRLMDRSEELIL